MITATVVGKEALIFRMQALPENIKIRLVPVIARLASKLQRHVMQDKLSGQVLHNITGTLRRSINYKMHDTSSSVFATVGTNVSYAAIHEYGFSGVVTVREHLRTITQVWGRQLLGGPKQIMVRAHPMRMKMPERSFLRSALGDMKDEIIVTLDREVSSFFSNFLRKK
jgi:phage gpG-like protein